MERGSGRWHARDRKGGGERRARVVPEPPKGLAVVLATTVPRQRLAGGDAKVFADLLSVSTGGKGWRGGCAAVVDGRSGAIGSTHLVRTRSG